MDHPLVKQILAGAKRILAHKKIKKEPITAEILQKLHNKFVCKDAGLPIICTMVICLLGYTGFFRFEEIDSLRESDKNFMESTERFSSSRVKQTSLGKELGSLLPVLTLSDICPVSMLERYFQLAKINGDIDKFLFRGLISTKQGYQLRPSGGLSYSRVRELLLEKLKEVGLNPKEFGLHSLRSGGATAAANAGVPDCLFKRHGKWLFKNAKDGYVKDKLEDRLSVTRNIGL